MFNYLYALVAYLKGEKGEDPQKIEDKGVLNSDLMALHAFERLKESKQYILREQYGDRVSEVIVTSFKLQK